MPIRSIPSDVVALGFVVAAAAPAHLRGTAFGIYNVASGLALLLASTVAAALWAAVGPTATFLGMGRRSGSAPKTGDN